MKPYRDNNRDSSVLAYEYGNDYISIQFKTGIKYTYRSVRIGSSHLAIMKQKADSGEGLNSYINKNPDVKKGFDPL